jgi:hypothetical protein
VLFKSCSSISGEELGQNERRNREGKPYAERSKFELELITNQKTSINYYVVYAKCFGVNEDNWRVGQWVASSGVVSKHFSRLRRTSDWPWRGWGWVGRRPAPRGGGKISLVITPPADLGGGRWPPAKMSEVRQKL